VALNSIQADLMIKLRKCPGLSEKPTHGVLASEFLDSLRSVQRSGTLTNRITKLPTSQKQLESNLDAI
jgi:hypothetical protein